MNDDQMADTGPVIPSDAIRCVSGLIYQVLRPGKSEEKPGLDDVVQVSIEARSDSSRASDSPVASGALRTIIVREAAPELAEALQLMTVGQKMRVWLPANLASAPGDAKERTLTYDIEMVGLTRVSGPAALPLELTSPRLKQN